MNSDNIGGKDQYVMFDLKVLHPDIWYWENAISYPDELVGFINDLNSNTLSHKAISLWEIWSASDNDSVIYGAKKYISSNIDDMTTQDEKINKKILYIVNSLKMAYEMCYERYFDGHSNLNKKEYKIDYGRIPIQKWIVGASMGPHTDGYDGHSNLAFSSVLYLNDNYEGGEINFPNHNIKIKPKKGSLIIFPSQDPFIHEVKPVLSGDRYMSALNAWKI